MGIRKADESDVSFWGLVVLLALLPYWRGGRSAGCQLVAAGTVAFLFAQSFLHGLCCGALTVRYRREDFFFLAAGLWILSSLFRSFSPPDAVDSFLTLLACFGTFFLARGLSFRGRSIELALVLSLAAAGISLIGLLQLSEILPHRWWHPRQFVAATFINHNHFAAYLEVMLPVSVALSVAAPSILLRLLGAGSAALIASGLLVSQSRGAWIGMLLAVGMGFGILWAGRRESLWNGKKILCALAGLAGIGFLVFQSPMAERLRSLPALSNDSSAQMRLDIWRGSWNLLKDHPLLGNGFGSFVYSFPKYRPPGLYPLINYAHNEYFQGIAELGGIGLALFLTLGFFFVARTFSLIRSTATGWKWALGLAGLIGLASVSFHAMVDFPWHIPAVAFHSFAVAGLIDGMVYSKDPHPLQEIRLEFSLAKPWLGWTQVLVVTLLLGAGGILARGIVADLWASEANRQGKLGKPEEAAALYQRATEWNPRRIEYWRNLAFQRNQAAGESQGHKRQQDLKEAARAYEEVLKRFPFDGPSADGLGLILQAQGKISRADEWLRTAVTLDPQNPLYRKHFAELKVIQGDAREASANFLRAAQLAKPYHFFMPVFGPLDEPDYFVEQGESSLFLGHDALAETYFKIAEAFDPTNEGAQLGLAVISFRRGNLTEAGSRIESVKSSGLRAKWFAAQAEQSLRKVRIPEAQVLLAESLKLDPHCFWARQLEIELARTIHDPGRYQKSIHELLSLNQPPVFVQTDSKDSSRLVWNPKKGSYRDGHASPEGWKLATNGEIEQRILVPAGRVHVRFFLRGGQAKGHGSVFIFTWQRRPVLRGEVKREAEVSYKAVIKVKPGESLAGFRFVNDFYDRSTGEDRNLKIGKVLIDWEPFNDI